jgi:trk system potassium uptake protein TrkA
MKVIVMGAGRVGSEVCLVLARNGHSVTVIDHDDNAVDRLGPAGFKGKVIRGLGFDRQALLEAQIETADAFVAASSSDNANIVAARIARYIFKVPRVIARLYDPLRAEVYKRLGLITISTTTWGAERIYELITHTDLDVTHTFGRGEVSILSYEVSYELAGRSVREINIPGEISVISVTREGQAFIPSAGTTFREGDVIHLTVMASAMGRIEQMLGLERRM